MPDFSHHNHHYRIACVFSLWVSVLCVCTCIPVPVPTSTDNTCHVCSCTQGNL